MKKIITSLAAAGILVAGTFAASTATTSPADAQATDTDVVAERPEPGPARDAAMDGLVADGTLTQAQADTVKDRLLAAHEERRAEREARREERKERRAERRANRAQIREFLEDDVITADELAQLSEDHPFRNPDGPIGDALADGEITRDELEAAKEAFKEEHQAKREAAAETSATA